jgi:hypothetical protein
VWEGTSRFAGARVRVRVALSQSSCLTSFVAAASACALRSKAREGACPFSAAKSAGVHPFCRGREGVRRGGAVQEDSSCAPHIVPRIDIGAGFEQQVNRLGLPAQSRPVQRCPASLHVQLKRFIGAGRGLRERASTTNRIGLVNIFACCD